MMFDYYLAKLTFLLALFNINKVFFFLGLDWIN